MAIVKMKRLRLLGMRSDRDSLFRALQRLGCVEIDEPALDLTQPQWAGLSKPDSQALTLARQQRETLERAIGTVRKYTPSKSGKKGLLTPRPQVSPTEFFDEAAYAAGLDTAQAVLEEERELAALEAERGRVQTQKAALAPWLSLDLPLETEHTECVSFIPAAIPLRADFAAVEAAVGQASELCQLFPAGADREMQYFLAVCHRSVTAECLEAMRPFGLTQVNLRGWTGTAADNDRLLDNRLAALDGKLAAVRERLAAFAPRRDALCRCLDRAEQDVAREEARGRLVDTQETFYLDGWFPAGDEEKLAALLAQYTCAWESADPAQEEYPQVPIQLKDGPVSRSMNTITEMYSLPAYDGIDPNPFMAPFFIVFFGMMMADMAYGILMIVAAAVYLKRARPKNPAFMEMIFWCGISTLVWGALTGGFFGDFIPKLLTIFNPESTFVMPALLVPLDDIVVIMVGSLALGLIQIFTGMGISVYMKVKRGEFIDALFSEITWWIILAGLALFACGKLIAGVSPALGTAGLVVLIIGALMLVLGGTRNAKGFGKVTSLVGLIYNGVTGYFSDTLSYIRLMALMVSGSVIASVFNTLGATFGNVVLFVVISMVGNALNFALNLLGCYVHDLRLQCLEFFGRFYKEGGRPYRPLSLNTKYIDIKEEN